MHALHAQPSYRTPIDLMKDFMNLSKNTDKTFDFWIDELRHHVPNKEHFARFEKQLREGLTQNQSQGIIKAFRDHKNLFGQATQVELIKHGVSKLQGAFRERLSLHHKNLEAEQQKARLVKALFVALDKLSEQPQTEHDKLEEEIRYQKLMAWLEKNHETGSLPEQSLRAEAQDMATF